MQRLVVIPILILFTSCGATNKDAHYLVPFRQGTRVGLSDEYGTLIVPCKYAGIIWYPPYYRAFDDQNKIVAVYDAAGKHVSGNYPLPRRTEFQKGYAFSKELATDRFSNSDGGPINQRTPDISYKLGRKPDKNLTYPQSVFRLEDENGRVLIPSVSEVDRINYRLLIIKDIDAARHRTIYPGIYDLATQRYIYTNTNPDNDISHSNGFPEVTDAQNVHHYLDGEGREITNTAEMGGAYTAWKFIRRLDLTSPDSIRKAGMGFSRRYSAISKGPGKPFEIYNDSFHVVKSGYTGLYVMGNPERWITVRDGSKWSLLDYELQPLIPPVSDTFIYVLHNRYAVITNEGKRYMTDLKTGDRLEADYDWISPEPVNGKWLAIRYVKERIEPNVSHQPRADVIHVIDKSGKVYNTYELHEADGYEYLPTANEKILRYPAANGSSRTNMGVRLYGGKELDLPYWFHALEQVAGQAIAIACRNDKGQRALVSALDFKEIVPFGNYEYIRCIPTTIPSIDGKSPGLSGIFINVSDEHGTTRGYGFFSVSGKKYWQD